jgi:very-short-patch-repair endonuclease
MRKLTNIEFIKKANIIHNNKYLYDNVEYISSTKRVLIECKEHGLFEQEANAHMRGQGCSKCKGGVKYNLEDFIEKSNSVHNYKYIYEKSFYIDSYTMIGIECKEHGYFEQLPNNHMSGQGCPKCTGKSLSDDELLKRMNMMHNNKYDYSLVLFTGMLNKVKIICSEHGIFEQKLSNHINLKQGCIKCANVYLSNKEEFIIKSVNKHGNLYNYDNVIYKGAKKNVDILCKKHGLFSQSPTKHLSGNGCPTCKLSKGEHSIMIYLDSNKIDYISQYRIKGFNLIFDFYLPDYNLCIEYDGLQHFKPVNYFGGIDAFNLQIKNDSLKNKYCLENQIKLLRIKYTDFSNIELILNENLFNS